MSRIFRLSLLALLLCATMIACNREGKEPTPPSTPIVLTPAKVPFREALQPVLYELPSGALATWRKYAAEKPVLVLFSTHPFLDPIPEARQKAIETLMQSGSDADIIRRGQLESADPLFLSPETVSVALAQGYFSELVVVLPETKPIEQFSLAEFQQRANAAGFLTEDELRALKLKDGVISGSVRGIPLRIAHPEALPKIERPVVLHIDHGYFATPYINEIKTPAYQMVYNLARDIRTAGFPARAVSFSFSNQEVEFSLESRFMLRDMAELLRRPELLDADMPKNWKLRAAALYATTMFGEDRARELSAQSIAADPDDAAAYYALSLDLFEQKRDSEAFAALDHAVTLDRGYALAYLELAEQGLELGRRDAAIELLDKAATASPDLPSIRVEQAHQLIQSGRVKEARPILAELQKLSWSPHFHPQAPELLKQMAEAAAADPVLPALAPTPSPEKPAAKRSRFNHMGMGGPSH